MFAPVRRLPSSRGAAATVMLFALVWPTAAPSAVAATASPPAPNATPGTNESASWSLQTASATGLDTRTRFEYQNFEAGASHADHLAIRNFTAHEQTFTVYAADAVNTASGAVDVLAGSAGSTGVGGWVRMPRSQVTVPAFKLAILPFSISIPSNATPGYHVGALVASMQTSQTSAAGQKIRVDYRVGSRIYVQVAGALEPKMRVEGVSLSYDAFSRSPKGGAAVVSYTIFNAGNVPLKGVADVKISGPFGLLPSRAQSPVPELLPGARIALTSRVGAVFAALHLTAQVSVHPVATVSGLLTPPPAASGSAGAWAPPWTVLAALGALALLGWMRRRRLYREAELRSLAASGAPARPRHRHAKGVG